MFDKDNLIREDYLKMELEELDKAPGHYTIAHLREYIFTNDLAGLYVTGTEIKPILKTNDRESKAIAEARQNTNTQINNLLLFAEAFQKLVSNPDVSRPLIKAAAKEFGNALQVARAMGWYHGED